MDKKIRAQLTYANVMATIAVFVAMGGGAYALTIPKNSVGAKQIKRNAVGAAEIKRGAVRSADVKNSSLLAADFQPGQLPAGAAGPQGPKGDKGDQGEPGATNVVVRLGDTDQIPPDSNTNVVANCEPGEVAVGGGLNLFPAQNVADARVWGTVPEDLNPADGIPEGWRGRGLNVDSNGDNMGNVGAQAVVVCASP